MPCAMIDMFSVIRLVGREYSVFGELLPISSDSIFFFVMRKASRLQALLRSRKVILPLR